MTRENGMRQDTWVLRLIVDGRPFGIWDKKTGGAVDSDDNKYYPGAMAEAQVLGGRKTTDNVTLQRIYDRLDDHADISLLLAAAGKGVVTITQRPMDPDRNEYGKSITYHGKLKRVAVPDVDSESSTAALMEIEVSVAGFPGLV